MPNGILWSSKEIVNSTKNCTNNIDFNSLEINDLFENIKITLNYILRLNKRKNNMKKDEKLVRKVTRVGKRSLSIVIPAEIVAELSIRERQKMVFKIDRKKIIISDFKS
jgi:hypothetical protein